MDLQQAAPRALHETNADRFASIEAFLALADKGDGGPVTAEWISALTLAWAALDELRDAYGVPAQPAPAPSGHGDDSQVSLALSTVRIAAVALRVRGYVLSVHQRPLKPLAMGHYETVIAAFKGRGVVA